MNSPTGRPSFAVAWRDGHRPLRAGKLEFRPMALWLEGGKSVGRGATNVPYREVEFIRIERGDTHGRHRRPTLVVGRMGREPVWITSINGVGTLSEVYDRLGAAVAAS
jgi:hypothetical protein